MSNKERVEAVAVWGTISIGLLFALAGAGTIYLLVTV